jgi:L-asparaginase
MNNTSSSILLIYTGGTIGMTEHPTTGELMPFDFNHLQDQFPELRRFKFHIDVVAFDEPIDSSDVNISTWQKIAQMIEVNYPSYDGFVVLHGTDTMAYSASALSFMLENLAKPVIFTGSQLPIGKLRTDGKENLITALEIAAARRDGHPVVQEVAIYFESQLFRGNRTHKYNTENFDAFESANLSALAEVGIHIFYDHNLLLHTTNTSPFKVNRDMDNHVGVFKIFPGMNEALVSGLLHTPGLKGLILETFGSGNGPRSPWFINALEEAIRNGLIVINISQCNKGFVEQGRYSTSTFLQKAGVIGGSDMTVEAALTKLMHLLAYESDRNIIERKMMTSLRGELTSFSNL